MWCPWAKPWAKILAPFAHCGQVSSSCLLVVEPIVDVLGVLYEAAASRRSANAKNPSGDFTNQHGKT